MKTKILKTLFTLGIVSSLSPLYLNADTVTWNSNYAGGSWTDEQRWLGGVVPTGSDDVIIQGPFVGQTGTATLTDVGNFGSLSILFDSQTPTGRTVYFNLSSAGQVRYGNSINMQSSSSSAVFMRVLNNEYLLIDGDINIQNSGSSNVGISMTGGGGTLEFNKLWLSASTGTARLQFTTAAGRTNEVIGDIHVGEGGWIGLADVSNGTQRITGNVTVDGGTIVSGRASGTRDLIKVVGGLEMLSGTITVAKNSGLEADTFTMKGGLLRFTNNSQTNVAYLRTSGDFVLEGGQLAGNLGTQTEVEIGGSFHIKNNPEVSLVLNDIRVSLAGDFVVESTALANSSNLNQLDLVLNGQQPQQLEAAVNNADQTTFRVGRLTLADSNVQLVDAFDQGGTGADFFWVEQLVNTGESTLDLNGLLFYYGDEDNMTLLTAGVYSDFGGTLNVIPEVQHAAMLVLGLGLTVILLFRRRLAN